MVQNYYTNNTVHDETYKFSAGNSTLALEFPLNYIL